MAAHQQPQQPQQPQPPPQEEGKDAKKEKKTVCSEPPAEFLKPVLVRQPQPAQISDTREYKGKDRLANKVVCITGGAGGIGRTMVEVFAKEGATVHFCDRSEEEGQGQAIAREVCLRGGKAHYASVDVGDADQIRRWLNGVGGEEGRIDAVVPNAATFVFATMDEVTPEDWDRIMTVNVKGYAFTAKHALPWLRKAGGGSICMVASVSSFIGQPAFVPYNASKGAIVQLMRCLAVDHGPENIRVNALCPGTILTGITELHAHKFGKSVDQLLEDVSKSTSLRRAGSTLECALAALHLISDESSYTTGSCLVVDGGLTAQ